MQSAVPTIHLEQPVPSSLQHPVIQSTQPLQHQNVLILHNLYISHTCQGERTKFDRFVDPNVRGAKCLGYSDLRMYCNGLKLNKIHKVGACVPRFDI